MFSEVAFSRSCQRSRTSPRSSSSVSWIDSELSTCEKYELLAVRISRRSRSPHPCSRASLPSHGRSPSHSGLPSPSSASVRRPFVAQAEHSTTTSEQSPELPSHRRRRLPSQRVVDSFFWCTHRFQGKSWMWPERQAPTKRTGTQSHSSLPSVLT